MVIAFVGKEGVDVTGESFRHGNLVIKGQKGVWVSPLDPGRYSLNPYTHKVCNVPTANVVLNWATGKTEAHKLDANLSTITVRSADGFKFNLDVSHIIHIPRSDAPKVIARFGGISALVTQVLEPTIGHYFRNAAQGSEIIDFLKNRSARQAEAREAVGAAEAEVIRLKIDSMEAGSYAVVEVADALAKSGAKLVPDIVAGGNAGHGGSLVDVLLAGRIRDCVAAKPGRGVAVPS